MVLNEFEKERALQETLMSQGIDACDQRDPAQCNALAKHAARVADSGTFAQIRFGSFVGLARCVVYVNMGPNNQHVRDAFRRRLRDEGVAELAVAVWPPDAHYTWAVFIDDADGDYWADIASEIWQRESRP